MSEMANLSLFTPHGLKGQTPIKRSQIVPKNQEIYVISSSKYTTAFLGTPCREHCGGRGELTVGLKLKLNLNSFVGWFQKEEGNLHFSE